MGIKKLKALLVPAHTLERLAPLLEVVAAAVERHLEALDALVGARVWEAHLHNEQARREDVERAARAQLQPAVALLVDGRRLGRAIRRVERLQVLVVVAPRDQIACDAEVDEFELLVLLGQDEIGALGAAVDDAARRVRGEERVVKQRRRGDETRGGGEEVEARREEVERRGGAERWRGVVERRVAQP